MIGAGMSMQSTRGVTIVSQPSTAEDEANMATTPSTTPVVSTVADPSPAADSSPAVVLRPVSVVEPGVRIISRIAAPKRVTVIGVRSLASSVQRSVPLPHSEVHVLLAGHRERQGWAAAHPLVDHRHR